MVLPRMGVGAPPSKTQGVGDVPTAGGRERDPADDEGDDGVDVRLSDAQGHADADAESDLETRGEVQALPLEPGPARDGGEGNVEAGDASGAEPGTRAGEASESRAVPGEDLASLDGLPEARVQGVDVDLTIWRSGSKPKDDGPKPPLGGARVDGVARYHFSASPVQREVILLDFAGFNARQPEELDALALSSYQGGPWGPVRGPRGMTVLEAVDDQGRAVVVERIEGLDQIRFRVRPGTKAVTLRYRVHVPRRYWPLGCDRGRCSLSGAVAPLPSSLARGGRYLPAGGRVVERADWKVGRVRFGDVPEWQPGTDPTADEVKALRGDEIVVTRHDTFGASEVGYPSIFWGPKWRRLRKTIRGVDVQILYVDRRPLQRFPEESVLQYRPDVAGHLEAIAAETLATAERLGMTPVPDSDLVFMQGPLRSDIAAAHPTVVMVSDEYLHVLPADRFRRFHEVQIARSIFDALAWAYLRPHQEASERLWLGGALSFAMTQVWQAARDLPDEDARDLLRNVSFMPAVDSFLYRGQANFASAYFRGGEDVFKWRNHPLWFAHELPTGRRIHEKLDDLVDDRVLASWHQMTVQDPGGDPIRHAEQAWGRELDWFFDQWLGRYPEVDYAVADLRRTKKADGTWSTEIEIWRDAEGPIVEPVQLLVVEKSGDAHNLIWNGEAAPGEDLEGQPRRVVHVFELETKTRVDYAVVDPRYRVLESSRIPTSPGGRGDNNDPRFNNRQPGSQRFIYTGIGLAFAASEFARATTPVAKINSITGFFAFEAGRRRDLRVNGTFNVFKDRETLIGAGGAANFFFLEKLNGQRRRLRLRASLTTAWLGVRGLDPEGGVRIEEGLALTDDTRRFVQWPDRGHRISAGIRFSEVIRTQSDRSDDRIVSKLFAEWAQLWPLAHEHVLATRLSGDMTVPISGEMEYRALARVGGLDGLAAHGADEVFGRAVLRAQAEYRHVFISDLRVNVVNLAWLRSLGGAAFGGVSTHSSCVSYSGLFGPESWRGQVGYGISAYVHYLGVAPQLIRLEAAVPIGRRRSACLGRIFPDALAETQGLPPQRAESLLAPVTFNLLFNQPF